MSDHERDDAGAAFDPPADAATPESAPSEAAPPPPPGDVAPAYPPPAPPAYPPPPPAYPPPAYGPPTYPPANPEAPPGNGSPPAYGPPAGWTPPPGWSPPPGWGPPPGAGPPTYEQASGYGPPPGYGPPGSTPPGYPPGYPPPPPGQQPWGYQSAPTDAFGRPLAEWWQRVLAFILDALVIGIPVGIVVAAILAAGSTTYQDGTTTTNATASAIGNLVAVAAALLYFGVLDGRGQTVGKIALGIAVRSDRTGYPIGVGRAMARRALWVLLWAAFVVPGILNALSPLWDRKRQAWHDHAVGSVVIKVR